MAYGSSRNSNIKLSVYSTAEKLLAKNIDAEAALTISSGMPTGKLVGNPLSKTTDSMFHFPDAHVILPFWKPILILYELQKQKSQQNLNFMVKHFGANG